MYGIKNALNLFTLFDQIDLFWEREFFDPIQFKTRYKKSQNELQTNSLPSL